MPETENNPVVEKVRQLQRKLWVCAKQSKTRRFHALYDRIHRSDVLWEAWKRVRSNGGAAGVDGETIQAIEKRGPEEFLTAIHTDGRWEAAAIRDSNGAGPSGADGGEDRDGADIRGGFPGMQLWIPTEEKRATGPGSDSY